MGWRTYVVLKLRVVEASSGSTVVVEVEVTVVDVVDVRTGNVVFDAGNSVMRTSV